MHGSGSSRREKSGYWSSDTETGFYSGQSGPKKSWADLSKARGFGAWKPSTIISGQPSNGACRAGATLKLVCAYATPSVHFGTYVVT